MPGDARASARAMHVPLRPHEMIPNYVVGATHASPLRGSDSG